MKVYLVRHAESEGMRKKIRLGPHDPLSNLGHKQAKNLGNRLRKLKINFAYSSPTLRSRETANIITQTNNNLKFIEKDEFIERREATSLIGLSTDEVPWEHLKKYRLKRHWRFQDGESLDDIYRRCEKILKMLTTHPKNSNILVITHGSIIRSLMSIAIYGDNLTPRNYYKLTEQIGISPTGITVLEYSKKNFENEANWKLITWMDFAHIENLKG